MKKSRKIFGAVALSAVLAFGTAVPAFADNPSNSNTGDVSGTNTAAVNQNAPTGSTTVNIATYSSHYDVTLPLVLPFMLDQQGGDGIAPTGYYIQNNGKDAAVEIWDVTWQMSTGNQGDTNFLYTFGTSTGLGNGTAVTDGLSNPIAGTGVKAPAYGSFTIEFKSADATKTNAKFDTVGVGGTQVTTDAQGKPLAQSKDGARYGTHAFNKGDWKIAAATTGQPADVNNNTVYTRDNIDLKITGTKLTNAPENEIKSVAEIVYTVGPTRGA